MLTYSVSNDGCEFRAFRTNRRYVFSLALVVSALTLGLCSCSSSNGLSAPTYGPQIRGVVHGGQQPVSGATIQLVKVGTSGSGLGSSNLLTSTVTTDTNGVFTITGDYSCGTASQVYLTASQGNPGLGTGMNNPQLLLVAALGSCASLTSSTNVVVNEVTTIAAAAALAPFSSSSANIGSTTVASDQANLATAFTLAGDVATVATGNAGTGTNIPTSTINTLGNILATCVNSTGGVSGDTSACGKLFAATSGTTPTNTFAAALNIALNPTSNASTLFALAPSSGAPFQPILSSAPSSWQTVPVMISPVNTSIGFSSAKTLTATGPNGSAGSVTWSLSCVVDNYDADFDAGVPDCASLYPDDSPLDNNVISSSTASTATVTSMASSPLGTSILQLTATAGGYSYTTYIYVP